MLDVNCIPIDESDRLRALRRLRLLDSAPEESFDTVTRLASTALRLPIVLMSLMDTERQWFKSRVGLDAAEIARSVSLCHYVVFERQPLVIADTRADPRFAKNPYVTGPPHARAYLGVPLFTRDRYPIGTLCGIDRQVRQFSAVEVTTMIDFAKLIEIFLRGHD